MLEIWIGFLATNIEEKKKRETDFQNLVWWIIFSRGDIIWDQEKKILSEDHKKNRKLICIKIFLKNKIFQFPNPVLSSTPNVIKNLWFWKALDYNVTSLRKYQFRKKKKTHTIRQSTFKAQKLSCVPRWWWFHGRARVGQCPGLGSERPVYTCFFPYLTHSHLDTNLTPKCTCYMLSLFEGQNLCVHETFISRFHW